MWGDEVQHDLRIAIGLLAQNRGNRTGVHWRLVDAEIFAEGPHPGMILVKLLASGQCAPRDALVDIGVTGGIADMFGFQATPGWRGDDLARLRLHVAEADFVVFAWLGEVGMVQSGVLAQGFPSFHRNLPVSLRGQHQHHFGGINVRLDARQAKADAFGGDGAVQFGQLLDLRLGVPAYPLATIADFCH